MKYNVMVGDLFDMDKEYTLAHCISSDFVMGGGIAKLFTNKGVKQTLMENEEVGKWEGHGYCLPCLMNDNGVEKSVINLVTKEKVYHKPTYDTLRDALEDMKDVLAGKDNVRLAMPAIGCGLDGLQWDKVQNIIKDVFKDTNYEIDICILEREKDLFINNKKKAEELDK